MVGSNSSNEAIEIFANLVERTCELQSRSLKLYWPSFNAESNGVQEANLIAHLSMACSELFGEEIPYGNFGEASNSGRTDRNSRLDQLIYFPRTTKEGLCPLPGSPQILMIEAKKLYSSEKAKNVFDDIQKMADFRPVENVQQINDKRRWPKLPDDTKRYGMALCVTEKKHIADWWQAKEIEGAPKHARHPGTENWEELGKELVKSLRRKSLKLYHSQDRPHYLLYALFRFAS